MGATCEDDPAIPGPVEDKPLVSRAVGELWQVEARWQSLGLLGKEQAATELLGELRAHPPPPGASPLGAKGMVLAGVAAAELDAVFGCGKLKAYLPEAALAAAAKSAAKTRAARGSSMGDAGSDRLEPVRCELRAVPLLQGTSPEGVDKMAQLMERIENDEANADGAKAKGVFGLKFMQRALSKQREAAQSKVQDLLGELKDAAVEHGSLTSSSVRVVGVQARPELNGREGTAVAFAPETGRYRVMIGGEPFALGVDVVPA